jgi:uncharacterized protein YkwD
MAAYSVHRIVRLMILVGVTALTPPASAEKYERQSELFVNGGAALSRSGDGAPHVPFTEPETGPPTVPGVSLAALQAPAADTSVVHAPEQPQDAPAQVIPEKYDSELTVEKLQAALKSGRRHHIPPRVLRPGMDGEALKTAIQDMMATQGAIPVFLRVGPKKEPQVCTSYNSNGLCVVAKKGATGDVVIPWSDLGTKIVIVGFEYLGKPEGFVPRIISDAEQVTLSSVIPPKKQPPVSPIEVTEEENRARADMNARRARAGLGPLEFDPTLRKASVFWAGEMGNTGKFVHDGYLARVDPSRTKSLAENIAWIPGTLGNAMQAWWNSKGHRDNMMSPQFKKVGFGWVEDPRNPGYKYWVTKFSS